MVRIRVIVVGGLAMVPHALDRLTADMDLVPDLSDSWSSTTKLRSCSLRLGWRSLRRALASIWRIRSRVTSNYLPTSSSLWSVVRSMPKRAQHLVLGHLHALRQLARYRNPRMATVDSAHE
jgi:hypothetical protein